MGFQLLLPGHTGWIAGLLLAFLGFPIQALAQEDKSVPAAINYQGKLTDSEGHAVPSGYYDVQFRIWDSPDSVEPGDYIWGRVFSLSVASNGMFNVLLTDDGGELTWPNSTGEADLLGAFEGSERYLGLSISRTPDGDQIPSPVEISPRQRLVTAPYAIHAYQASTAYFSNFSTNAGKLGDFKANEFVMVSKPSQTITGNVNVVSGNVGIGTTTPSRTLHVAGSARIDLRGNGGGDLEIFSNNGDNSIYLEGYGTNQGNANAINITGGGDHTFPLFKVKATDSRFTGNLQADGNLRVAGGTMLDLSASGGGALVVTNKGNDNSVYMEGYSADHSANATAIHITGRNDQTLPTFNVNADAVKVKSQKPIVIHRYFLPDLANQAFQGPHFLDPQPAYSSDDWSAGIIGFTCNGDFSTSSIGYLLDIAMQKRSDNRNWRVQFDVRHHSTLTNIVVDVMYIMKQLTDDDR